MTPAQYTSRRRKSWLAQGLTSRGTKRINRRHPELSRLKPRAYHTAYMKKQRAEDRAAWTQSRSEGGS